ncbi:hypothetical protein YPPY16_1860, partial [Yersinia pestis PY-16]|jgi:tubulin polyglutamylase TTLL4
MNQC